MELMPEPTVNGVEAVKRFSSLVRVRVGSVPDVCGRAEQGWRQGEAGTDYSLPCLRMSERRLVR